MAVYFLEFDADQLELLENSTERFSHVPAIYSQYLVDEIDDVGTYHTDLIYDDELYFTDNLDFLRIIFQCVSDIAHRIHTVVGQQWVER